MYFTTQVRALGMPFLGVVHGSPASEPSWILENSDSLLVVHLRVWGSIYFICFLSRDISFSFCFCSVAESCLTLWDLMGCNMPGFPVLHYLLEFSQTHVHQVGDAIQPSHPLLSPFPPAFHLSQHQGLFQWVSSSHQVAKVSASASVLPMNIQDWLHLGLTGLISLLSKELSRVFSSTTVQKHQFFSTQPSYILTLPSIHD